LTDPSRVWGRWPDQGSSNLDRSLALAWPVDRVSGFGDVLLAIDVASSKIGNVVQVATILRSNSERQSRPSAAIVRYPARRSPRWTT
jgi:hypothetical protein